MSSPVYNPPVPYVAPIPGGFLAGRTVRVQGRVNPGAHSFAINLQSGPGSYDDVALHVNARFNEAIIVRNSKIGSWGTEERHGPPMPIAREQNFEILILAETSSLKIAVNGQHFSEFTHRLPLERVTYINVEGDLTISLIQFDGTVTSSSAYNASAPPMGYAPPMPHGGGLPYPSSGSALPSPGFTLPAAAAGAGIGMAAAGAHYPSAGGGYPASTGAYPPPAAGGYPGQSPYGGYAPAQQYQPQGGGGYYPPQQPGYPPPGQAGPGYYQPQQPHQGSGKSGGILGDASKLLAGGLAGVGLAKVANKIPGLGGGGHGGGHGYPGGHGGYPGGGHHGGGGGGLGGILGTAGALGVGGLVANKAMKKGKGGKKNKLLKYGVPVGGALVGGYALKKGMKGFKHGGHGSSSSSSSSSEEE